MKGSFCFFRTIPVSVSHTRACYPNFPNGPNRAANMDFRINNFNTCIQLRSATTGTHNNVLLICLYRLSCRDSLPQDDLMLFKCLSFEMMSNRWKFFLMISHKEGSLCKTIYRPERFDTKTTGSKIRSKLR